jgi:hypothetical protein
MKLPDPDPLVRGMDPRTRIRIHPKMSWIRNTGKDYSYFYTLIFLYLGVLAQRLNLLLRLLLQLTPELGERLWRARLRI